MLISYALGQTSIILRVKILNSSVATGAGLTGLTYSSSGLIISTIADNEAAPTIYTVAASHVETVATLGTFGSITASKCQFAEVDATNHKGVYEIHIADARFAVSSSKSILISISGATNCAETDVVIPLTGFNPYDSVRGALTALPNAAAGAAGGLVVGSAAYQLAVDSSGRVTVGSNADKTGYTASTVSDKTGYSLSVTPPTSAQIATAVWQDATAGDFTAANSVGKSVMNGVALGTGLTVAAVSGAVGSVTAAVTVGSGTVTTLTNLPAVTTDWLTAAGVKADAVTKIQNGLATPTNITAGTITTVTNLTNAPTAGDLTATMKTSVTTAATAATPTAAAVTGAVGSVTGLTTATIATAVMGSAIETGVTLTQAIRQIGAADAGKLTQSGGGPYTVTLVGLDDSTTRASWTVDAAGQRTAVTRTL